MKDEESSAEELRKCLLNLEEGSELHCVVTRWSRFNHVVRTNEAWRFVSFVTYFQHLYELLRAISPTLPPQLPPQCVDPDAITEFFNLPVDAFDAYRRAPRVRTKRLGLSRRSGRPPSTKDIADFVERHRHHLTWKEIFTEYRESHAEDTRVRNVEQMRGAWRRWYCTAK